MILQRHADAFSILETLRGEISVYREVEVHEGRSTAFHDHVLSAVVRVQAILGLDNNLEEARRFLSRYGLLSFNPQTRTYNVGPPLVDFSKGYTAEAVAAFEEWVKKADLWSWA